jgi:hypothetical protein
VRCENLFLILNDRFLIAQDLLLVADHSQKTLLVLENASLIPQNHSVIRQYCLLVLERRLGHCRSLL